MADIVFNTGLEKFGEWSSLDVRALMLKSSVTPVKTNDFVSDVVSGSGEISVTGYTRQTVAGETETVDDTNHWLKLSWDTITYSGMSGTDQTAGWVVFYIHNAADSAAQLLVAFDVANVLVGASNAQISWACPANGFRLRQGS